MEYRLVNKGYVLGAELTIRHPMIDPQKNNDILLFDGKSIHIDMQRLPPSLTRLIPSGYLTSNVRANKWEGFINKARELGLL